MKTIQKMEVYTTSEAQDVLRPVSLDIYKLSRSNRVITYREGEEQYFSRSEIDAIVEKLKEQKND